jgi:isoleucyl-tRNA synthetase
LDSGTMPFSQDHYPFDFFSQKSGQVAQDKPFKNKELEYPADFISEAIDQTRGWFYTLHAVGVLMGKGKAFRNVICLGHILDANGKKMSKSLGNIVDPWTMIEKYGADTLRLWMYSVNQPGESKNFDEKTVSELHNKVFNLLYNVLAFYNLYRDESLETINYKPKTNSNILDQWIFSRLGQLLKDSTENLENYKLLEPVRDIREFIDNLSTWYVRRSRERLKNGDVSAKQTLYFVLKTLSQIIAPFAPFLAEDIWQKLKTENDEESVHLTSWPKDLKIDVGLIEEMQKAREIVTLGLQARQKEGIPVRQPLRELKITNYELSIEYQEIIKDELNVKEIKFEKGEAKSSEAESPDVSRETFRVLKVELDINISEDLKREGQYRELVRALQDFRKKNGLNPNEKINLFIQTDNLGLELIEEFKDDLSKVVGIKELKIEENNSLAKFNEIKSPEKPEEVFGKIKINDLIFKIEFF